MNKPGHKDRPIYTFNIWDYPIFAMFLGYVWLEMVNPLIASSFQVIPKVPNSAIVLLLCYLTKPDFINQIRVPFNPVRWTLPFLIVATINLPFIQYAQIISIQELISTWFWVLFLTPLIIRVLATPSGRWHFVFFSAFGLIILAWQYYWALNNYQFTIGDIKLTYHHLAGTVVAILPLLLGYLFIKN